MTVWISKRPDDEVAAEPGPKPRCSGRYPAGGERQRGRSGAADDGGVSGVRLSAGTRHRGGRGIARRWRGRRRQDEPRPVRHGLVGTRSPYGLVPDSRRPHFISGVSSSGSAEAVANGEADIAIDTDTAGSGRVPAGLQGIVGIKPTVGVISTDGVVPACESYDCVTIFAPDLDIPAHRLVRDRREVDRLRTIAMSSLDGTDALMVPTTPMHPRIDEVAADPVGCQRPDRHLHQLPRSVRPVCGRGSRGHGECGAVRDYRVGPCARRCRRPGCRRPRVGTSSASGYLAARPGRLR